MALVEIAGTSYRYDASRQAYFGNLTDRVREMHEASKLSSDALSRILQYFRIKQIYHSNAIEGNTLSIAETKAVAEQGLTITGKPLEDQAEARNLSDALDFLEKLVNHGDTPVTEHDVRQLHSCVLRGLSDDAGSYRTVPVAISGSEYKPPGPESVLAEMAEFGRWFSDVSAAANALPAGIDGLLAAAVAHTWFVTVHPFIDGNGRVARLLLNVMLMRYGYPIAIITKEDRFRYYDALESSQSSDLTPFLILLNECIEESLEDYEKAVDEQHQQSEWLADIARKFNEPELVRAKNEYEVWENAMELLKSYLQQIVALFGHATVGSGRVFFRDFGNLSFEKYLALSSGESAKQTWFARVDIRRGDTSARYLLFFGNSTYAVRDRCAITLHVAREEPQDSYNYERPDNIQSSNVPDLAEIGYEFSKEQFVVRIGSTITNSRVEKFIRDFLDDVVRKHFNN